MQCWTFSSWCLTQREASLFTRAAELKKCSSSFEARYGASLLPYVRQLFPLTPAMMATSVEKSFCQGLRFFSSEAFPSQLERSLLILQLKPSLLKQMTGSSLSIASCYLMISFLTSSGWLRIGHAASTKRAAWARLKGNQILNINYFQKLSEILIELELHDLVFVIGHQITDYWATKLRASETLFPKQ